MGADVLMDKVVDHYDRNPGFASALNQFVADFEYPNWSHRTIAEVMAGMEKTQLSPWVGIKVVADSLGIKVPREYQHYSQRVMADLVEQYGWARQVGSICVKKTFADTGRSFVANFDTNESRYLFVRNDYIFVTDHPDAPEQVFDIDCRYSPELAAEEMDVRIKAVNMQYGFERLVSGALLKPSATVAKAEDMVFDRHAAFSMAKSATEKSLAICNDPGLPKDMEERLKVRSFVQGLQIDVASPEVFQLWAELDSIELLNAKELANGFEDSLSVESIAGTMGANAFLYPAYKDALLSFSPDVANEVVAAYQEDMRRIMEKEARKAAESAEMTATRWKVSKNEKSGMVRLVDRWDIKGLIIEFGGVPAIQAFAKERPEVPGVVINELLGRDGGWDVAKDAFYVNDGKIITLINGNEAISLSVADSWCEAAQRSICQHSLHEAKVIAFSNGLPSSVVDAQTPCKYAAAKVVGLTERHAVLGLGRSAIICSQGDLDREVAKGEVVSVAFEGGKGRVSPPAQARAVER